MGLDWTGDEGLDELEDVVDVVDGEADGRGDVKSGEGLDEFGCIKYLTIFTGKYSNTGLIGYSDTLGISCLQYITVTYSILQST